jgi:hypothetical protein
LRATAVRGEHATRGRLAPVYVGRFVAIGALAVAITGSGGCDKKGVDRFDLKGKVTFRGRPIPKGYLLFAPDGDKGNSGPGAKAGIADGNYETLAGQGTVGGPHVVTIFGADGVPYKMEDGMTNPIGKPLFPTYRAKVDLPKQSGTYDFEVPAGK